MAHYSWAYHEHTSSTHQFSRRPHPRIDALVGARGRSAFIVETAREAVKRRRLLEFLQSDTVYWNDEDHPELANGSAAWVKSLRAESETRLAAQKPQWDEAD